MDDELLEAWKMLDQQLARLQALLNQLFAQHRECTLTADDSDALARIKAELARREHEEDMHDEQCWMEADRAWRQRQEEAP